MTDALINSIDINKTKKGQLVYDVSSNEFIEKLAIFFKEKNVIKPPKWSSLVKCSHANELSPISSDYMYFKAAAICRILYITKSKTIGVGSLKSIFGKKERRGSQPPKFMKSGGKIIREIIKQLKSAKYVENYGSHENNISYGLVLTKQGRTELDKIASKCIKEKN